MITISKKLCFLACFLLIIINFTSTDSINDLYSRENGRIDSNSMDHTQLQRSNARINRNIISSINKKPYLQEYGDEPNDNEPKPVESKRQPTHHPTNKAPTNFPTVHLPTHIPSFRPSTHIPSSQPTTQFPSPQPTIETANPTEGDPTIYPTVGVPTMFPTDPIPSIAPTLSPTMYPSSMPTLNPTAIDTTEPTITPTLLPSQKPTTMPSLIPTSQPSASETSSPTISPTFIPPTDIPTMSPSMTPTTIDSNPATMPTVYPTESRPTSFPTELSPFYYDDDTDGNIPPSDIPDSNIAQNTTNSTIFSTADSTMQLAYMVSLGVILSFFIVMISLACFHQRQKVPINTTSPGPRVNPPKRSNRPASQAAPAVADNMSGDALLDEESLDDFYSYNADDRRYITAEEGGGKMNSYEAEFNPFNGWQRGGTDEEEAPVIVGQHHPQQSLSSYSQQLKKKKKKDKEKSKSKSMKRGDDSDEEQVVELMPRLSRSRSKSRG